MLYECIYFVLSATDQVKAVKELPQHISETTSVANRTLAKRLVGEPTVNRLAGLLTAGVPDVNILILLTCFFMFPREE